MKVDPKNPRTWPDKTPVQWLETGKGGRLLFGNGQLEGPHMRAEAMRVRDARGGFRHITTASLRRANG